MTLLVAIAVVAITLGVVGPAAAAEIKIFATRAITTVLDFLLSPTSIAVARAQGMEPAGRR